MSLFATARSLLFVPGARSDRFAKAAATEADTVCIDLEDAVAPKDKDGARRAALDWLAAQNDPRLGLRVNQVGTEAGAADLDALKGAKGIGFIMVPKPTSTDDLDRVSDAYGRPGLVPVMESARAVQRSDAIADHEAVVAGVYGAIDLSADIGCQLAWEPHLYARSRCALAFGAARKTLFDVPYLDVADPDGLHAETLRSKALGIPARAAIHPAQLGPIHAALSPTDEEVAHARRVVDAFDAAEDGLALLDGKLIELPVVKGARRVLALAAR